MFTRELAVLLRGGVPLAEALASLQEQAETRALRRVIGSLLEDVENGQPLSSGLARFPQTFDTLYSNLVKIGEASGKLRENLIFLSRQLDESYALRRKIEAILLYPSIVLGAAFILGALISIFILPKLTRLFEAFEVTLPLSTRILLWIASFMQDYGLWFFGGLAALFLFLRMIVSLPGVKPLWHRFILALPGVGTLSRDVALAHFSRDMGVMLGSGLPILEALATEKQIIHNRSLAKLVARLEGAVARGGSLGEELALPGYQLLPSTFTKMVASGEKTGKLSETFIYLETFLESEVDRRIKNITVLFEPMLLFVVGLFVAFLALAILTPIYSLTDSVRR